MFCFPGEVSQRQLGPLIWFLVISQVSVWRWPGLLVAKATAVAWSLTSMYKEEGKNATHNRLETSATGQLVSRPKGLTDGWRTGTSGF